MSSTSQSGASASLSAQPGMHRGDELAGKVALVTGSGRNIGRAIALSLAAGGARVAVNTRASLDDARAVVGEIRALGGEAELFQADISQPEAVQAMVDGILERFGQLDILVLNAATRQRRRIEDISLDDWRRIIALNLESSFICVKACLEALKRSGAGRIVTLGGLGLLGTKDAHVTASKYGVVGLTKVLAHELAEHGICVNCVSPGQIDTERAANPKGPVMDVPLNRRGTTFEIAGMVRALCGPAGGYTTGQTLNVNGGLYKSGA